MGITPNSNLANASNHQWKLTKHRRGTHGNPAPVPGGLTAKIPLAAAVTISVGSKGNRFTGMGDPSPFPSVISSQIPALGPDKLLHWKRRS